MTHRSSMAPKNKKRPPRTGSSSPAQRRNNTLLPNVPTSRHGKKTTTSNPPRYKPPARFLTEIRDLQKTTHTLIPATPFARLVREITVELVPHVNIRFQGLALKALHEASEAFLVGLFEDSYLLTLHRQRITLMAKDIRLAQKIRGDFSRWGARDS